MVESAELERVGSISSRLKGTRAHKTAEGGLVQSHPQVLPHFRCAEAQSKMAFFKDFPMNHDFRLQRRAELAER